MAYNTVHIKNDSGGKPIPQYYDKVKNEYEVLEGHNGASKTILYDKDGNEVQIDNRLIKIINILEETSEGVSLLTISDFISDLNQKLLMVVQSLGDDIGFNLAIAKQLLQSNLDIKISDIKGILDNISEGTTSIEDIIISSRLILSTILDELENIYNKDTTKTFYGLSTETKPTTGMAKGNAYFEIDTSEVYMWNGTSWVVI